MGRWLLRGVVGFLILGAVVRGGAALNLWQVPNFRPKQSVSECIVEAQRGYGTGVAKALGISREQIDAKASAEMTEAMRTLSRRRRHALSARLSRNSSARILSAYGRLCRAGVNAALSARPDAFWFSSRAERRHLLRDHCRLLLRYMGNDQSPDWPRLIAENPDFFVRACGAALHASLAEMPRRAGTYTAGALHRIGRRSCREGLQRGVLDTSNARGLLDFRSDDRAWDAIIVQVARAEGHA